MTTAQWADDWDEALSSSDPEPLEVLRTSSMYLRYFEEAQRRAVGAAREKGASWQDIADASGITRQTAWQKLPRRLDE